MKSISILLGFLFIIPPVSVYSQITTSNISGIVRTNKNETLHGASILVTHEPTGTKYAVQSSKQEDFI